MRTADERYLHDPEFHRLVDYIEAMIYRNQYTPSEVRMAAMLACINYESKTIRRYRMTVTPEVETALNVVKTWRESNVCKATHQPHDYVPQMDQLGNGDGWIYVCRDCGEPKK